MFSQLPMYQRQGKTAFKKDLTNSIALSEHLGYPEKKIQTIHVAGTNGKGSTSHLIASVLQESGLKVGLYTSPHLKDFTERIRINGKPMRKNCVINFVKRNKEFLEKQGLSFFEMTVGMAFDNFSKNKVDIAVIEVGLGGRLDSTNIINPLVSVITNIGIDHTQFLGTTLPEIAFEKAGIIKQNTPVIIGEKQEAVLKVFEKIAKNNNSIVTFASDLKTDLKTDLKGDYQTHNVKTAIASIRELQEQGFKITKQHIKRGLLNVVENTSLLGRWQILKKDPKVICDTAHNKEGLYYVMKQLLALDYEDLHIVLGVVSDKELDGILPLFPKNAHYYFCKPNIPRGMDELKLHQSAQHFSLNGTVFSSVKKAYKAALKSARKQDVIFVGGSTFVVAEVV
ncbi:MAG: folylpolyglutamate synthase/dihydrofolate synthase family protein [Flavobacteriaceae bacterium]